MLTFTDSTDGVPDKVVKALADRVAVSQQACLILTTEDVPAWVDALGYSVWSNLANKVSRAVLVN